MVHPIWLRSRASIEGFYLVMWELQPLSTNRKTTEISLLLEKNTSLTISQIPHNFVGLLSFTFSSCSLVSLLCCNIYGKDALPIYRQASLPLSCKRQKQGKWHQLMLQVAPNWCPLCWLSLHQLVPASFTLSRCKVCGTWTDNIYLK